MIQSNHCLGDRLVIEMTSYFPSTIPSYSITSNLVELLSEKNQYEKIMKARTEAHKPSIPEQGEIQLQILKKN